MTNGQQDTEITLGTGRMLAIFFAFVLVCAFFFAIGFSLGRRTAAINTLPSSTLSGTPAAVVRPSAAKSDNAKPATDFSFYKAVGDKTADTALAASDAKAAPLATSGDTASKDTGDANAASAMPANPVSTNGYFVQVAAVSRQEDAASLVEALKKKQYPAFTASNAATDKFFHVQVGPYTDLKDAEAMRARLVSDGYNPILKK
jgi:DedD protein